MALALRSTSEILNTAKLIIWRDCRTFSSLPQVAEPTQQVQQEKPKESRMRMNSRNPNLSLRHVYPEFLPDPEPKWRNSLREKLERADMLKRRAKLDIPEFYVGSILAVTVADTHAQGKTNRFVGICIERKGCGLRAEFTLRNVVEHLGVEVRYDLYDPTVQNIQVLRLEKRLDDKLYYLRDALPEYSTFPFDMDPEILPEGTPVPLNPVQNFPVIEIDDEKPLEVQYDSRLTSHNDITEMVKLKSKPWLERWERQELKGVANIEEHLKEKDRVRRELRATPWEKYDLMKQYRKTIPIEDQNSIWAEVNNQLQQLQLTRKKTFRKRTFSTPKTQLG